MHSYTVYSSLIYDYTYILYVLGLYTLFQVLYILGGYQGQYTCHKILFRTSLYLHLSGWFVLTLMQCVKVSFV